MFDDHVLRWGLAWLCVVGCGSEGGDGYALDDDGSTETSGGEQCVNKEPGTDFAPCKTDSDCYSGFCDETGNPGPYCSSSSSALAEGRGIACSSHADCPVPGHAAKIGVKGVCAGSNIAQNSCGYVCKPDAGTTSSTAATSGAASSGAGD